MAHDWKGAMWDVYQSLKDAVEAIDQVPTSNPGDWQADRYDDAIKSLRSLVVEARGTARHMFDGSIEDRWIEQARDAPEME